jgi:glycine/D-amino acid oxidase-like deaminating enzyme
MDTSSFPTRWGNTPWTIDFHPPPRELPAEADFAVVGAGFTGLACAAWLRYLDPTKSAVVLEATSIGAGSSGHTGGMALGETSAGDLPGLGDVLKNLSETLAALQAECELTLPGALELGRKRPMRDSPINWPDGGQLRAVAEVEGGSINPGKMAGGLARAADRLGAAIIENARVETADFGDPIVLRLAGGRQLRAKQVLFATNAMSLELNSFAGRTEPKFTLAVATEPLSAETLEAIGLGSRRPFYTIDLPYLWGRMLPNDGVIFGCGLVHVNDWRELEKICTDEGQAAELIGKLESRVRKLHPALRGVQFTNRWGGPILIDDDWQPIFSHHPKSGHAIVAGAYCGHGVALSVHFGRWAAEAMLCRRELPHWENV